MSDQLEDLISQLDIDICKYRVIISKMKLNISHVETDLIEALYMKDRMLEGLRKKFSETVPLKDKNIEVEKQRFAAVYEIIKNKI